MLARTKQSITMQGKLIFFLINYVAGAKFGKILSARQRGNAVCNATIDYIS